MSQENVREKVKQVIQNKGITQSFLCRKIGIPTSVMSQFVHGKKELYPVHLEALNTYMDENYQ